MAKITISDLTAAFASTTALNAKFQQIEDALNNLVLYRDNTGTPGEPNSMSQDMDMAGFNLLNVNNISSTGTPSIDADNVVVVPAGGISSIDAQAVLEELDTEKANITYVDTQDALAIEHTDISETEGLVRKTGANTYEGIKTKLDGTGAPTVNDDASAGYAVNSPWVDETNDDHYVCVDSTNGAAAWIQSGTSNPGGVTAIAATAPITSSGGAVPTVAIVPATSSVPGSMSAADKTKLDGNVALLDTANTFTKIQKWSKGANITAASALTFGTDGNYFEIDGTTTINSINPIGGTNMWVHFNGILTLTHHVTDLVLPGGVDIVTAVGDEAEFVEYASGDWRCVSYQRAASIGSVLNTKIFDIGDWDMDTSTSAVITHGINLLNIRAVNVLIRNDSNLTYSAFPEANPAATTVEKISFGNIPSQFVELHRGTSGSFDSVDYNATSYNRGWVTIQYVD